MERNGQGNVAVGGGGVAARRRRPLRSPARGFSPNKSPMQPGAMRCHPMQPGARLLPCRPVPLPEPVPELPVPELPCHMQRHVCWLIPLRTANMAARRHGR